MESHQKGEKRESCNLGSFLLFFFNFVFVKEIQAALWRMNQMWAGIQGEKVLQQFR